MMNEPRPPARRAGHRGLFNTVMGPLQRQLRSGEYNLFRCATLFESDFVQVSKRGGTLDVHNQVQLVRVAIAATSPRLRVPNVLLLARPVFPPEQHRGRGPGWAAGLGGLTQRPFSFRPPRPRLLPLCFVKISIHDLEKQQLRFKMATGRTFYLQLCPQLDRRAGNFDSWVKVVHLLRPPLEAAQAQQEQPGGEPALCTAEVGPSRSEAALRPSCPRLLAAVKGRRTLPSWPLSPHGHHTRVPSSLSALAPSLCFSPGIISAALLCSFPAHEILFFRGWPERCTKLSVQLHQEFV
uniref:Golgi associated RAB2 interactor protein-like Rab2B-binding domain-containing protein n=1 Tax=Varanus komodoensis TaxID=61221 RepID=A0A8D2KTT5_VARKO